MEVLKDKDCTINTPVVLGVQDSPIYGKGISIKPRVDGRKDSKHFESIYLPELLPLEEYDLIVVLISGGKDSIACFYKLLELGVPKEKIELWHHDIDGGHPSRRMDWKCTQNYMKALADAEGVKLRVSYRVNGFFGELYRIGASEPIEWIDPDTDEVKQCKLSSNYLKCQEIKEQCLEEMEDLLKEYGCRMKFPAKSPDLSRRWCSAYVKYYYRYMDDIVILGSDKKELHKLLLEIKEYFRKELKLTVKDNWQVFPTFVRGIDFVGYRTFLNYKLLRKSTCKQMKRKMNRLHKKVIDNNQLMNYSEWCAINSYKGWLIHCDSFRLSKKYIEPLEPYAKAYYEYQIKKGGKAA